MSIPRHQRLAGRAAAAVALLASLALGAPQARADDGATQMPGLDLSDDAPKPPPRKHKKPAPEEQPAPVEEQPAPVEEQPAPTDAAPSPSDDAAAPQPAAPAPAPAPAAAPAPAPAPAVKPEGPKRLDLKGPAPKVVVVFEGTDPGTRDQGPKVTRELSAAFGRDGRMQPVEAEPSASSAAPAQSPEVAQHLKAAQDAYTGLDLDTAVKEYAEALRTMFQAPESADADQAAKTFLSLGATYQLNGDVPHAEAAYRFALALRPELQPDPQQFGPDIRKSFEAQRQALRAAAQSAPTTLDVDVDGPASSEVSVDGQSAGSAPVRGFKVWPGRHLVAAHASGFLAKTQVVALEPGSQGQVHLALEETPEHKLVAGAEQRALSERGLPQPGPGIAELAQKTGAQAVVVGSLSSGVEGTRIELTFFDAAGHRRVAAVSRELLVEGSGFPAAMDALALELGNDWTEPPSDALAEAPGASRPVYKRWYFWAGVGAAVAAGAAVGIAASSSSSGSSHFSTGAGAALGLP